jgi:hypothetical protein
MNGCSRDRGQLNIINISRRYVRQEKSMTGRRLSITIEPESYFLDIPDYSMSCDEIDELIRKKIKDRLQDNLEFDTGWEWIGEEPKSKEQSPIPRGEAWLDINGYHWNLGNQKRFLHPDRDEQ